MMIYLCYTYLYMKIRHSDVISEQSMFVHCSVFTVIRDPTVGSIIAGTIGPTVTVSQLQC